MKIEWRRHVDVQVELPGTRVYAIVRLRVANTGDTPGTITPTQFWLLDSNRREFLSARKLDVPDPLVGRTVKPGAAVAGQLVFGVPHRIRQARCSCISSRTPTRSPPPPTSASSNSPRK